MALTKKILEWQIRLSITFGPLSVEREKTFLAPSLYFGKNFCLFNALAPQILFSLQLSNIEEDNRQCLLSLFYKLSINLLEINWISNWFEIKVWYLDRLRIVFSSHTLYNVTLMVKNYSILAYFIFYLVWIIVRSVMYNRYDLSLAKSTLFKHPLSR